MKNILLAVWLLAGLAHGQGSWMRVGPAVTVGGGTIVHDGTDCASANNAGTGTSPFSCGSLVVNTTGDTIVCEWGVDGSSASFGGISDSTNGTYLMPMSSLTNGTTLDIGRQGIAYLPNVAAGSYTPALSAANHDGFLSLACQPFKNVLTAFSLDGGSITQVKDQTTVATNPTSGSTQSPTTNGELILGFLTNGNCTTPTPGTNYSLLTGLAANCEWPEYWIQTTGTATNTPYTMASDTWRDEQTALLPAGASPGVLPLTVYNNASGGTNGATPTTTTVGNSGAFVASGAWTVNNANSDMTFATKTLNCQQGSSFINGATFTNSSSTLAYQFATGTGTDGVSFSTTGIGTYAKVTMAYCFETSIPQTDSNGNRYSLGSMESEDFADFCDPQIFPTGSALQLDLESSGGGASAGRINIATNTVYQIQMTYATASGGCQLSVYDTTGAQVGSTLTNTTLSGSHPLAFFGFAGTSGAEAESAGFNIWVGYVRIDFTGTFPLPL